MQLVGRSQYLFTINHKYLESVSKSQHGVAYELQLLRLLRHDHIIALHTPGGAARLRIVFIERGIVGSLEATPEVVLPVLGEPWISTIVRRRQAQEVLFETDDHLGIRLNGDGAFDLLRCIYTVGIL